MVQKRLQKPASDVLLQTGYQDIMTQRMPAAQMAILLKMGCAENWAGHACTHVVPELLFCTGMQVSSSGSIEHSSWLMRSRL